MLAHRLRDGDPAGPGNALDARGDVDAVAEKVAALDDDVAEVDSDAEFDSPVLGHVSVAGRHGLLHGAGTLDRIHDARKFDEHAIAGEFDDATRMPADLRLDELGLVLLQALQGTNLIGPHQPAVADDIGSHDRGKPALHLR